MPRFLILADGQFGPLSSKTANGCIRYSPEQVVAVLDAARAGETVQRVLGFGGDIPIVATLAEGLALRPDALLIGIAPMGGRLPESWRALVRAAIDAGLDVWSGLHTLLGDDPELRDAAQKRGVTIRDLRRPPADLAVATGRVAREVDATVVLTVGSDCNVGKMTAALQVRDAMRAAGARVAFAGTGQTGVLIEGWGIAVDAVVADFVAGAAERLVLDASHDADVVLVEGQGSLLHPGYSGVTYGLMHGALPHAMVLCTQPSRTAVDDNEWVPIPPLPELVRLYERALAPLRASRVVAIALNTFDLDEAEARAAIARASAETGLPATDPVRYDPAPVADAILAFHQSRVARGQAVPA